jgi:hypothetical protein
MRDGRIDRNTPGSVRYSEVKAALDGANEVLAPPANARNTKPPAVAASILQVRAGRHIWASPLPLPKRESPHGRRLHGTSGRIGESEFTNLPTLLLKCLDIILLRNCTTTQPCANTMSSTSVAKTSSIQQILSTARNFRIIPRIETYPAAVTFVQTPPGKIALLALFALGERFFLPDVSSVVALMALLAIISFMPEYRRFVLAVAPVIIFCESAFGQPLFVATGMVVMGTGMLLYLCAVRWPNSRFGRRPIAFLLTGFSLLIVAACYVPAHTLGYTIVWYAVGALASYVWFIAYAMIDRNSKPSKDWTLELATFGHLWGSTNTPFPKGAAYLRRIEAKTPEQLAVTQLKGLKLLTWAILLAVLQTAWFRFFHGYLHIPLADQALASVNRISKLRSAAPPALGCAFSPSRIRRGAASSTRSVSSAAPARSAISASICVVCRIRSKRSSGMVGLMGTYAAPDHSVPSTPAYISILRDARMPTVVVGARFSQPEIRRASPASSS